MTQRIEYTEEMVGNAHPTKADTLNRFINLITAQGDILYGTALATAAKLAIGAANLKLFVNAAGTMPEWALGVEFLAATRDMTAATGDVVYSGIGFKPSVVIVLYAIANTSCFGIGITTGTTSVNEGGVQDISYDADAANDWAPSGEFIGAYTTGVAVRQLAILKTFDADGFTLTWTKTGAPAGTLTMKFLVLR